MTDPTVSVFIPTHRPRYLEDALLSLVEQTFTDWEAVVLTNNGAAVAHRLLHLDPRIRFVRSQLDTTRIGALKAEAVSHCRGQVLVELDHDDWLLPHALTAITHALHQSPAAAMVYSDTLTVNADGSRTCPQYAPGHGWTYTTSEVMVDPGEDDGNGGRSPATWRTWEHPDAMAVTPHNMGLIWYAPNHVRAFTREAYNAVGGYNPDLAVLDDQDLMSRLYCHGWFRRISPVYVQRSHDDNTQVDPDTNAAIQVGTWDLYEQYLEPMALADAERRGLVCLDLGGAHGDADPRYTRVDQHDGPGVGLVHTLPDRLPYDDRSVAVIRAHDFLEHVTDKVALINELHRVLIPGGLLLTLTPSTDGRGAFQDPTHVAFYNEHSFWYYTQEQLAAYVPDITARFQVSRVRTYFPTPWHAETNISYVQANLIALHHPAQPRQGGPIGFQEFQ